MTAGASPRVLRRASVLVVVMGVFAGLSCSALVASTLPSFTCDPDHVDTCPTGMICDTATAQCVTESPGKPDRVATGDDDDDDDAPDGFVPPLPSTDAALSDTGVGPCRTDIECTSRICGDKSLLTPTVVATTGPVCATTCCTSADCLPGDVCFGSGTGGNYCVGATELGRKTPGAGEPGSACGSDGTKCRSGSCIAGKCIDTCCKQADCKNGLACKLQQFDEHYVYACGTQVGTVADGDSCADTTECKSGLCYGGFCRPTCCSDAFCTAVKGTAGRCTVQLFSSSGDAIHFCFFSVASKALAGTACDLDDECRSEFCDPDTKKCAELCCVDTDCKPTFACRPSSTGRRNLHCVPK